MSIPTSVPFCKWAEGSWRRILRVPRLTPDEADRLIRESHAFWARVAREHGWLERLESVVVWLNEDGSIRDSIYTSGPESTIAFDTSHDHAGEDCNGGVSLTLATRLTQNALGANAP